MKSVFVLDFKSPHSSGETDRAEHLSTKSVIFAAFQGTLSIREFLGALLILLW